MVLLKPSCSKSRRPRADRGASIVECALIIALIALIAVPSIGPVQKGIKMNMCRIMKEQWDVSGYFDEATGRCKRYTFTYTGAFW